ncbi:molybdenum cofactor biosynthesis protein B [Eubacterium multiforme]|uniref:Molybdenum cofactor synthesis domain-containing protein n=1 Tax=Eubacterium multiforme TaxID=83339 RepID=A0ABT9URT9_9FIRM|nr:MogA/MoaB family molybdenum cofactor biosynthesis protein [Eubacterium multiforme]MDQ0148574.1 molybdenum cofactor synthesis domain-containing protein [Eubacterium multiforme]
MYTLGIITSSDKGSRGEREDKSGEIIKEIAENEDFLVKRYVVLPDEREELSKEMKYMSDELKLDLVLTTGGTGFSERDVTPEATKDVIHKEALGIAEAIRNYSFTITKRAMLSRGTAGIRNKTLIVNMPGSPKACKEILDYLLNDLKHGLDIMKGSAFECARK